MRKLLLFIVAVGSLWAVYQYTTLSRALTSTFPGPCSTPIPYTIGSVDSQYDLNEQELKQMLAHINSQWSAQAGRPLFVYKPDDGLEINLIFDEQQRRRNQEQIASEQIAYRRSALALARENMEKTETEYNELKNRYEKGLETYRTMLKDEQATKTDLRKQRTQTRQLRIALNSMTTKLNKKIEATNQLSIAFSDMVDAYNETYQGRRTFKQGLYKKDLSGSAITIYSFSDKQELQLVLTHEMGHALGLSHVDNPESIMYYQKNKQPRNELIFTEQDKAALESLCN